MYPVVSIRLFAQSKRTLLLILSFLFITFGFGQTKYDGQMFVNLSSHDEQKRIQYNEDRYGFSFQTKETYEYRRLLKAEENLFFAQQENRRWGMVDSMNRTLLPFEYAIIKRYIHGDYFIANWDGKMGVLTPELKKRYDIIYEDLLCFKKDNCLAKKGGLWGAIKPYDEAVIPFKYKDITFGSAKGYQVKDENGWGLLDSLGISIIEPRYTNLPNTTIPGYQLAIGDNRFDLYHLEDKVMVSLNIDDIVTSNRRWIGIVKRGTKYGLIKPDDLQPAFLYDQVYFITKDNMNKHSIFAVQQNGRYGILNTGLGLISAVTYDEPINRYNNRIQLTKKGISQIIDTEGQVILPPTDQDINPIQYGKLITVGKNGIVDKIIDLDGQTVVRGPILETRTIYGEYNLLYLRDMEGWNIYNFKDRKYLIRQAKEVKLLQTGFHAARFKTGWRLISIKDSVSSATYPILLGITDKHKTSFAQEIPYFRSAQPTIGQDGHLIFKYGLINGTGKQLLTNEYRRISQNSDSTLMLEEDLKTGRLYNFKTQVLGDTTFRIYRNAPSRPKYIQSASPMPKGPVPGEAKIGQIVKLGDNALKYTKVGWKLAEPADTQEQLPDGISYIAPQINYKVLNQGIGVYYCWKDGKVGLMDEQGKMIISPEYEDLVLAKQASGSKLVLTYACKNGKYALMKKGIVLTPFQYDEIRAFQDDMARVRVADKWGFINLNGEEVVPPTYDIVFPFELGFAEVSKDGKIFFINKSNICQVGCN